MQKIEKLQNFDRLCIHTMTHKPWNIDDCIQNFSKAGVPGISVWRNVLEKQNLSQVSQKIKDHGLSPVSLVRGGFFTSKSKNERECAVDENKRAIDEAAAIGAPLVVLVCGATPGLSVQENLKQIQDGIEATLPHAISNNVKLGIEPLHPMYGDIRSAVTSMRSANRLCERINSDHVGVTIDVFHLWWEEDLEEEIKRCGEAGRIFSFHVCDWKVEMEDMLTDRGMMGEGIIQIQQIRSWVETAGFDGFIEVEIFSEKYWKEDQFKYLEKIKETYLEHS